MSRDILIIDDDEVLLFLHEVVLKEVISEDAVVKPYNNATEAFEYIQAVCHENRKTLILLDLNMPKVSGWDFLDRLNEEQLIENIVVIIITSSINEDDKSRAKDYNQVVEFMEKPMMQNTVHLWKKNDKLCDFFI